MPVHVIPARAGVTAAHLVLVRPDGHVAWAGPLGDLHSLIRFMDRPNRRV